MVNCVAKLEIFSSLLADCHFETILEARIVDMMMLSKMYALFAISLSCLSLNIFVRPVMLT